MMVYPPYVQRASGSAILLSGGYQCGGRQANCHAKGDQTQYG